MSALLRRGWPALVGGLILAIYAMSRSGKPDPNIGAGFVVLIAYALIAVGVISTIVYLIERRNNKS
jgi:hypothetical protein